jgi:hypothetical protein
MLDEELLRAELEAKDARMKSALWSPPEDPAANKDWSAMLSPPASSGSAAPVSPRPTMPEAVAPPRAPAPSGLSDDQTLRLAALERTVTSLLQAAHMRRPGDGDIPEWLLEAAGNPLTYDAREGRRRNVCARILPSTYAQLKQAKTRLGLRSIAGAWEYMLRLGLAVVARGQAD